LAYTTACTTVQAVMDKIVRVTSIGGVYLGLDLSFGHGSYCGIFCSFGNLSVGLSIFLIVWLCKTRSNVKTIIRC